MPDLNAICIDTETTLIKPGEFAPTLVCLSWYSLRNGKSGILDRHQAGPFMHRVLDSVIDIVGHNFSFDITVLSAAFPELRDRFYTALDAGLIRDTMLRQKMLDVETGYYRSKQTEDGEHRALGYNLDDLSFRHLGKRLDKDTWRLRYGELIDLPIDSWEPGARDYPIQDAIATGEVFRCQENGTPLTEELERTWFTYTLYHMSRHGLAVDPTAVASLTQDVSSSIRKIQYQLQECGYLRVKNLTELMCGTDALPTMGINTGQVRAAVTERLAKLKIETPRLSDTGLVKIDKVNCRLADTPNLKKFAEYKELDSVRNKDLVFLQQAVQDGSVHTYFDSYLATGRTSSSRPNIQNIRRFPGIRECFVPRPGHVYLVVDYGSAELHTLAQTCLDLFGYSRLADTLNANKDAHIMMGADIAGMSYDELYGLIKAGKKKPAAFRQMAKGPNYGFPGGMGSAKFVEYIEAQGGSWNDAVRIFTKDSRWLSYREDQLSRMRMRLSKLKKKDADEAARQEDRITRLSKDPRVFAATCLKQIWTDAWPEMKDFFKHIHESLESEGGVCLARTKRFRATDRFTAACNYMFQGPASDGAALAAKALFDACYRDSQNILYGCNMVHFIHDEFIIEAPVNVAELGLTEMCKIMKKEFDKIVPDVPVSVEGAIKERWSK